MSEGALCTHLPVLLPGYYYYYYLYETGKV